MEEEKHNSGQFPHPLTAEDRAKGGRSTSAAKALILRVWCNPSCRIFYRCPMARTREMIERMSVSDRAKLTEEGILTEKGLKCSVKFMPLRVQTRIAKLFEGGRDGIADEMRRVAYEISIMADNERSSKLKLAYHALLKDTGEFVYGRKINTELSGSVENKGATAEDLMRAYEKIHGKKYEEDK
jgi:hypothetical protein